MVYVSQVSASLETMNIVANWLLERLIGMYHQI
jgi:hypothetical protein